MPTRTALVPPVEVATVTIVNVPEVSRWGEPWKLTAPGIVGARFRSPEAIYEAFFVSRNRMVLEPTTLRLLLECLAEMGVSHGTDPRGRSQAELDALPVGASLTYFGMGESFHAVKQKDGTWRSEVGIIDPTTLRTCAS